MLVPKAGAGGAGIAHQHPEGVLVIWLELAGMRVLTPKQTLRHC